jgi:hypothetical protein
MSATYVETTVRNVLSSLIFRHIRSPQLLSKSFRLVTRLVHNITLVH